MRCAGVARLCPFLRVSGFVRFEVRAVASRLLATRECQPHLRSAECEPCMVDPDRETFSFEPNSSLMDSASHTCCCCGPRSCGELSDSYGYAQPAHAADCYLRKLPRKSVLGLGARPLLRVPLLADESGYLRHRRRRELRRRMRPEIGLPKKRVALLVKWTKPRIPHRLLRSLHPRLRCPGQTLCRMRAMWGSTST